MRILVIEDEQRIALALKKGLEQEHYTVDVVFDGQEGYDLASSESYDLLILDLMLPSMDGIAICTSLRSHKHMVPILMLTARGQTHEKVQGLDSGADDYLTKPFSFEELLARVRALTRRPNTTIESVLTLEDLTLNPQTFEAKRAGTLLQLSSKEFALLEYMMRHPNMILTKDQLISHVWSYESSILPNTVEASIRNLRKKIELPFPKLPYLIHTVRGFGYKLGAA